MINNNNCTNMILISFLLKPGEGAKSNCSQIQGETEHIFLDK